MDRFEKTTVGVIGIALIAQLAIWAVVIWAIVKVVQHFT